MKEFIADTIRGLSALFGKSDSCEGRHPINAEELDLDELSPKKFADILNNGSALISWYSIYGEEDHFYIYVIENGLLVTYKIFYDGEKQLICPITYNLTTPDSFIKFFDEEIKNAGHIYLDKEQVFKEYPCPKVNITKEEVENSISSNETFYVTRDRLVK